MKWWIGHMAQNQADMRLSSPPPAGPVASPPASWRRQWLFGLGLFVVTLLAYLPVWHAGFIWDDDAFLVDNPLIKAGNGLYQFWCTTAAPDYFPMTSTTLWLEWRLWGNHPLGYHLVNLLLHAASSLLLWRVLTRLKIPGAWLAAAIFALHPVNVESVAWITERKNTLAMFFYAWALLGYLRFEDTGRKRWYGLLLGAFALALLSKTAVVPLPFVLLGLAWWRRGRLEWKDIRRTIPLFAAAFLLGLLTVWFQYHQHIGAVIVRTDSIWSRLAGAGCAVWFYLYKALWPLNLMFVYPRWSIEPARPLSYVPGLLLAVVFLAVGLRRGRWAKAMLFALGYFVVMLLPVLGFLNIYFMRYSLVADHWQYFSIPGPITLMAAVLTAAWKSWGRANPRLGIALGGALLLALGALTWKQAHIYSDNKKLWQDTLAKNPACMMAHYNLGLLLDQKGDVGEAIAHLRMALDLQPDFADGYNALANALIKQEEVAEAIVQYQKALDLQPDFAKARFNLGNALIKQGVLAQAIAQYRMALKLRPNDVNIQINLANALFTQGHLDEAVAQYRQALSIAPDNAHVNGNLGKLLLLKGDLDAAMACLQKAAPMSPDPVQRWYKLGNDFLETGDWEQAIACYRKTLSIQPGFADAQASLGMAQLRKGQTREAIDSWQQALAIKPDLPQVQNRLAWLLATDPDASLRNGAKAVALAQQANQLTGGENPIILCTLAAAYAETGRYDEATATARKALNQAEAQKNDGLADALKEEIKLFEAGLPMRETK
jgi:tetratricopeptide (TPR) repeat protein